MNGNYNNDTRGLVVVIAVYLLIIIMIENFVDNSQNIAASTEFKTHVFTMTKSTSSLISLHFQQQQESNFNEKEFSTMLEGVHFNKIT